MKSTRIKRRMISLSLSRSSSFKASKGERESCPSSSCSSGAYRALCFDSSVQHSRAQVRPLTLNPIARLTSSAEQFELAPASQAATTGEQYQYCQYKFPAAPMAMLIIIIAIMNLSWLVAEAAQLGPLSRSSERASVRGPDWLGATKLALKPVAPRGIICRRQKHNGLPVPPPVPLPLPLNADSNANANGRHPMPVGGGARVFSPPADKLCSRAPQVLAGGHISINLATLAD